MTKDLLTHSIQRSPAWEANRFSPSQEITAFYGNRKFITAFSSPRHLRNQFIPRVPPPFHLILSIHLLLDLPNVLLISGFLIKTLYASPLPTIRTKCLAYIILLDLISRVIFGEQYRSLSSSLCNFLHSPVTSPFYAQTFPSALCSQTPLAYVSL
jgi:hypothetical protein